MYKTNTEPTLMQHMFQIMSLYLVPAQTPGGFERESSQHLIYLLLPSPLLIHRPDKAVRPSGSTAFPNEPDLGMREELVKHNHTL